MKKKVLFVCLFFFFFGIANASADSAKERMAEKLKKNMKLKKVDIELPVKGIVFIENENESIADFEQAVKNFKTCICKPVMDTTKVDTIPLVCQCKDEEVEIKESK